MNYSLLKSVYKGLRNVVMFALPIIPIAATQMDITGLTLLEVLGQLFPILSTLTVGGAVTIFVDYLKHKNK